MKIAVIGLGSMGRRRIRLLKQISEAFEIVGIDGRADRCAQAEAELGISTISDMESLFAVEKPDCVIVSTAPLSHASIIERSLEQGCHVFTELNLVDDKYVANMHLAEEKGKVLFLSSTFLYRDEIVYIKKRVVDVKGEGSVNYNYHVGQYLPDWHPWENINEYFVSDKRTNGCRELFAIELPWITKVFGEVESISTISGNASKLPIQYADNYIVLIKHANGNKGCLCVDVISRKAVRNLEIYGESLYISWDGTPNGLKEYDIQKKEMMNISLYEEIDKQEGYAAFVIENAYRKELEVFFALIRGVGKAEHSFKEDYQILKLIDRIENGEER